ncbi:Cu2+-exporting ATPase [Pseudochelatococcus lubricantis]|uniref:Cu2+-exporting ATPase n=1 Tax=Pseudochelatococcus lubricantis TaxID=1538102 RepID=A0ABX0UYB0_9HYPH|nr:heavy metal translocating P-type ATPase [Pseudochelatococcus lubricantis]NIJ57717.1 Cu2+-exporting ATPase [Pseudochelatococcus lubricantis]
MTAAALDLTGFIRHENGAARLDLAVEGMTCAACIGEIEHGLQELPGLVGARVNYSRHRLTVNWDERRLTPSAILDALRRLGYRAQPYVAREAEEAEAQRMQHLLKCLAVAGFASMNVMLLSVSVWAGNVSDITPETRDMFHWISALIALPAAAYAGQPFFSSAWRAIRSRHLNMDVPITLGIMLGLGMSIVETMNHAENAYFDAAVTLLFFLLCGRVLDQAMRRKTRAVAGNLAALKAATARRVEADGTLTLTPAEALRPGERVQVLPGERVPADGRALSGESAVDESLITGETHPRDVASGDTVYAGSLNRNGTLTLEVTAAGEATLIDDIERLLEAAQEGRSRYLHLADRAARAYAPIVHGAALITLVVWMLTGHSFHDAAITAIAVLIITCPCALALAIPAVQVVAAGTLFRANLLLGSGDALERLAEADTIVFDKTGTLTVPDPRVANAPDVPADLLAVAGRLALSSSHPLSAAVAREAGRAAPFEAVEEHPGEGVRTVAGGVETRLGSPAFCGFTDHPQPSGADTSLVAVMLGDRRALLEIRQTLRADAVRVARELARQGLSLIVLSGDRPDAVAPVAGQLGIEAWRGGLKPQDKIAALAALKAQGRKVLMVGDGLNDAPALAAAHVSLSPVTAADLTQAQADGVFLGDRLAPVLAAVRVSRRARRLMLQNLGIAAIYNLIAVPLAFLGQVTPLVAAVAMSGSSLLVTANALRARLGADRDARAEPAVTAPPGVAIQEGLS